MSEEKGRDRVRMSEGNGEEKKKGKGENCEEKGETERNGEVWKKSGKAENVKGGRHTRLE